VLQAAGPAAASKRAQRSVQRVAKQALSQSWTASEVPQDVSAAREAVATLATPVPNQVADLETILQERDACGVRFIATLISKT
jgi:hypothetical protein